MSCAEAQSYEDCAPGLRKRELITPASMAADPDIDVLYSGYE